MRKLFATAVLVLTGCQAPTLPPSDSSAPPSPSLAQPAQTPALQTSCDPAGIPFGGGNGTADSPNAICSTDQLRAMGGYPNDAFVLVTDLDFTGETDYVTPVSFHGTFDGGNHTISGLRIRNNVFFVPGNPSYPNFPGNYLGLWYTLGNTALVKNLKFSGIDISGNNNVGVVAGTSAGLARIENVQVLSGSLTGASSGLVSTNDGTIHQCANAIGALAFAGSGTIN